MDQKPEEPTLTPEEIAKRKKEMEEYYDAEIPFLTKRLQYEMLVTQMEEAKARRLHAQVTIANILAPDPDPSEEPREQTERKLKKD